MKHKDFIEKLNSKRPSFSEDYEILTRYTSYKEKLKIRHKACGNIFYMDPGHLMRGQGCPDCHGGKKDNSWFVSKVKEIAGDEYTPLGEYITGKTKLEFKHEACGTKFSMRPEDFLRGQRCPHCSKEKRSISLRKSPEVFNKEVFDLVGDEYSVLSKYTNCKNKVLMKHNKCGAIFEVNPSLFLYGGSKKSGTRCPLCYGSIKKNEESVSAEIETHDNYRYIPGSFSGVNKKLKILHIPCGHIFETTLINFRAGHGCPRCAYKSSSASEKELLSFIKQYYPNTSKKRFYPIPENRRIFFEADICIEEKKLIIEYNGIYWHCTKNIKDPDYHLKKSEYFESLGYRVAHIFEDEWANKKDAVKKKLLGLLEVSNLNETSDVEDVIIKKSDTASKEPRNHMTTIEIFVGGSSIGSISFTFGDNTIHITEYSILENSELYFRKIIGWLINEFMPEKILLTIDLTWPFDADVYYGYGFKLSKKLPPKPWYYKGLSKSRTKGTGKNPLVVYDCGSVLLELPLKKKESL